MIVIALVFCCLWPFCLAQNGTTYEYNVATPTSPSKSYFIVDVCESLTEEYTKVAGFPSQAAFEDFLKILPASVPKMAIGLISVVFTKDKVHRFWLDGVTIYNKDLKDSIPEIETPGVYYHYIENKTITSEPATKVFSESVLCEKYTAGSKKTIDWQITEKESSSLQNATDVCKAPDAEVLDWRTLQLLIEKAQREVLKSTQLVLPLSSDGTTITWQNGNKLSDELNALVDPKPKKDGLLYVGLRWPDSVLENILPFTPPANGTGTNVAVLCAKQT